MSDALRFDPGNLPSKEEAERIFEEIRMRPGSVFEDVPWQVNAALVDDPYERALYVQKKRAEEAAKAREAAEARRAELMALAATKREEAEAALREAAEIDAKHGPALSRAAKQEAARAEWERSAKHNQLVFEAQRKATVARLHPDLPEQRWNRILDQAYAAERQARAQRASRRLNDPMWTVYDPALDD